MARRTVRELEYCRHVLIPVRRRRRVICWLVLTQLGEPLTLASNLAVAKAQAQYLVKR